MFLYSNGQRLKLALPSPENPLAKTRQFQHTWISQSKYEYLLSRFAQLSAKGWAIPEWLATWGINLGYLRENQHGRSQAG